jgi:hypothetical protein
MTKILHVYGDDYAACDFEKLRDQGLVSAGDLWAEAFAYGHYMTCESEDAYFEYAAFEFGSIDPSFVEWVKGNQDHDAAKSENFYVVED